MARAGRRRVQRQHSTLVVTAGTITFNQAKGGEGKGGGSDGNGIGGGVYNLGVVSFDAFTAIHTVIPYFIHSSYCSGVFGERFPQHGFESGIATVRLSNHSGELLPGTCGYPGREDLDGVATRFQ